jgi:glutathione S-transferase
MIRFYYGSGSPYSWRVQLLLEEKGLSYEPVLLSFQKGEHKSPEHLDRHPHGKVPVLSDGGLMLYDSTPIVEYLEERYPKPAFLPTDPSARALVRIEEAEAIVYFGETFRALARQKFFPPPEGHDPAALDEAMAQVRSELARLDIRGADRGGDWVCGSTIARADFAWIPFVELAGRAGIDIEAAAAPWLYEWRERMRARPSYARSYPPHWRAA